MAMVIPPLDTRTFDLSGSHYQIGLAIGQGSEPFSLPAWWPEPPTLAFANACAREIAAIHAPLIDELYGHADAQQQSYADLLRIVCRQRLSGRPVSTPERGGCTSLAWRTDDGHILVGRNYDFYTVQRVRQRVRLQPDCAFPTVGMRGSVPGGRYDGVNQAGLFVSLHVVLSSQPQSTRPGVPFHLIPRILLETCSSVGEAIDKLTLIPHLHSFNYLLADPHSFAAVECHADRLRIVNPEGDKLAVGNFYRHPDMLALQPRRVQAVSRARVAWLEAGSWQDVDSWEAIRAAMTDHSANVCGHTGGHTTLWSCVADLSARRIGYTTSAPCIEPYLDVRWPGAAYVSTDASPKR